MTYTVYAVRCDANGRIYVGSTKDFDRRIRAHISELRRNKKTRHANASGHWEPTQWQLDYNKFGEGAFKVYVLERDVPYEMRREREEHWIAQYRAAEPEYGYNVIATLKSMEIVVEPDAPPLPPGKEDT